MPSFWMTYFNVDDIDETVAIASKNGGKIEMQEMTELGRVALIRDPNGAGFTCIENEKLPTSLSLDRANRWCGSELFVSDATKAISFYENLFRWKINQISAGRYSVARPDGSIVTYINVVSNAVKGDKEYWMVYFSPSDLEVACRAVEIAGGSLDRDLVNDASALAYDDQGAAFMLVSA